MTPTRRRRPSREDAATSTMPPPSQRNPERPANVLSLAGILEDSITQTPLGEWLQSSQEDIHARLVHFSSPSDGAGPSSTSSPPYSHSRSVRSAGSSMAPACVHQSTVSTHPPSLYNYSEATPTETSVSTGLASHFSGVPLLEDDNGVLVRPENYRRTPVYECVFWFLKCSYISTDMEEWKTHCLSHFLAEEPPASIQCPLCDFQHHGNDGRTSWNLRMDHIAFEHAQRGETLKRSRPDFELFQHLWRKRLIGDQDLKELKGGNHNLTREPTNYTVTNSRREWDTRRQRSQHIGRRPPGRT